MNSRGSLLAAMSAGAGLAYLLDPDRGARRRALIRDKVSHASSATRHAIEATTHDAKHRTYGAAASLRQSLRRTVVGDEVVIERVRATLGRIVSHPHAIRVSASSGVVTLRGPILRTEADVLIKALHRVPGVRDGIDEMERHDEAGNIPALQGDRAGPADRARIRWSPTMRCIAGTAGVALATAGIIRRDGPGTLAALVGVGLMTRAGTNLPISSFVGISPRGRRVEIQKTITIDSPVGEVFTFWSWYENFPKFMSRVLDVRPTEDTMRSQWKVLGPAGMPVSFEAEVTRIIPNQRLEWRTVEGAIVAHAGIVMFEPVSDGRTRVQIRMSYNPPAGWLGHGVAVAFGVDPKHGMDADLARMKTLIETGHAPHDAAALELH
jgi:uncharacterized membrane protein